MAIPRTPQVAFHMESEADEELGMPNLRSPPIYTDCTSEGSRLRDRSATRRRATEAIKEIKKAEEKGNADELAWSILQAKEVSDELLRIRAIAPAVEHSNHESNLKKAIFIGERILKRLDAETARPSQPIKPTVVVLSQQLPPSTIPKFGSVSFNHFVQSFDAVYGDTPKARRLVLLKDCIKDTPAYDAIFGFDICDKNFDLAMEILKKRYDRPDQRKVTLMNMIMDAQGLNEKAKPPELRRAIDKLTAQVRELESLGISPSLYQTGIRPVLESKLPRAWREKWIRHRMSKSNVRTECNDTFEQFLEFLHFEINVTEEAEGIQRSQSSQESTGNPFKTPVPAPKVFPPIPSTTSVLQTQHTPYELNDNERGRCVACNNDRHSLAKCFIFLNSDPRKRKELVTLGGLCYNCLGPHEVTSCKSKHLCWVCKCKHHTLLCQNTAPRSSQEINPPQTPLPPTPYHYPPTTQTQRTSRRDNSCAIPTATTYYMTARAALVGPWGEEKMVRVLFDSGSDLSYIRSTVAEELGLPVVGSSTFACTGFQEKKDEAREYQLVGALIHPRWGGAGTMIQLWRTETLCSPMPVKIKPGHPQLDGFELADDFEPGEVDVLIGSDQFYDLMDPSENMYLSPGLRAIGSRLGWIIHGRGQPEVIPTFSQSQRCNSMAVFSDLETLGILPPSPEEDMEDVGPSARWNPKEEKIEVGLFWKNDERPFDNFSSTRKRFESLERRLQPDDHQKYSSFMEDKLSQNIIAESPHEWKPRRHQFFLPHRHISQGKFRVVFDGSATDGIGRPLNSYLDPGPNLLPRLFDVLIGFRTKSHGFSFDCKSAFHQVKVADEDEPYLQFFWEKKVLHFRRTPFGLTNSPFSLNKAVSFIIENCDNPDIAKALRGRNYVDDITGTAEEASEVDQILQVSEEIFSQYGFQIHKKNRTGLQAEPSSIMGLKWKTNDDELGIEAPRLYSVSECPITRRQLQSKMGKIWDPLGWLTPWTLRGKILLQDVFALQTGWDEPFNPEFSTRAANFFSEPDQTVWVPRSVMNRPFDIEVFCDASQRAYCACIYAVDTDSGKRNLICAKSRLSPSRQVLTIPRLELMGALIGVRLLASVIDAIKESKPVSVRLFTDSKDVLYWLRRRRRHKLFVKNRVDEILKSSTTRQWFYVPTNLNPADRGTRGSLFKDFITDNLWWNGPPLEKFVPCPFDEFQENPTLDALKEETDLCYGLKAPNHTFLTNVTYHTGEIIDLERYSSLHTALSVIAYVLRIRDRLISLRKGLVKESRIALKPSVEELQRAKSLLVANAQSEAFDQSILHRYRSLRPYEDTDGLIKICPRTLESGRILLPAKARITELIIMEAHRRSFHQGVTATSSILSSSFHVARSVVKRTINSCRTCRRYRGLQLRGPEGSLPNFRTSYIRPFHDCGIDFFGPLYVREGKRYVLLITCSTTRAIHLELVASQSSEDTDLALRRFIALRGIPASIMSDNARTFKKLSIILSDQIRWSFIPERSPWWGGFWERLVGVTKRSLRITLHGRQLDDKQLSTILYELAFFVNLRPLTPLEDGTSLTPAHFIFGVPINQIIDPVATDQQPLNKAWKIRFQTSRHLQQRWLREYLPQLRQWRRPTKSFPIRVPTPGDLVIVQEDGIPRGRWPVAKVISLITGRDGYYRSAKILLRGIETRRALQRLYQLELSPSLVHQSDESDCSVDYPTSSAPVHDEEVGLTVTDAMSVNERLKKNLSPNHDQLRIQKSVSARTRRSRPVNLPARFLN